MRTHRHLLPAVFVLLALAVAAPASFVLPVEARGAITTPEEFFGFQIGADRKIARWDRIVEYFGLLEKQSGRMKVIDMGPTTEGNPFLQVIITSPQNLSRLERLREINAKLSDPRGVPEAEIDKLIAEGRAVICQTMSLHATEIGGTQMAVELAYDLASRTDEETRRILDNVVFFMVPSFNPDGQIMVTDWYNKWVGTEYEGTGLPWLYHKYAGHDNNRDAFMTNLVESQYLARLMFREWPPQAYVDHHQMGSYGARIYVPPYAEPIRPYADPLIWREHAWYGAHIAYKAEEAGLSGVINASQYSGWGHFGFHWITPFHNIAGMLTEAASTRLATPLFIHRDQLRGGVRGLPEYEAQTTFPNPWPGGWWRLRDMIDRMKVSAWATLDIAARNREVVLRNAYLKAKRQTERGAAHKPAAFVIPATQHDPLTMVKMINKLLVQGIEIHRAKAQFTHEGVIYPAGSFVVSMAQPKMGLIRYLLWRTFYPDNSYTRDANGNPIRPYDMATDTMYEFMGVRVDPVDSMVKADLVKLTGQVEVAGNVARGSAGYVLDGRLNQSFRAVNLLLAKGVAVRRVDRSQGGSGPRAGDFVVPAGQEALYSEIAKVTGVDFAPLSSPLESGTHEMKRTRIAMYQRYNGGNMDEGWTRLLLEQFDFPYTTIRDADIKRGNLNGNYDVIVLPSDSVAAMTGERAAEGGRGGGAAGRPAVPPEYVSGFGSEGVAALEDFVRKGGTLVTFAEAGTLAMERFGLPLRNAVAGRPSSEFYCPGSTLHARVDNSHPLAYGMPEQALVTFLSGSQVFELVATETNEIIEPIVTFPERDLLQSGWLIGERFLAKKTTMAAVRHGEGQVVLIGFRAQHRAQTDGTYKLVFNALAGEGKLQARTN